MRSTAAFVLTFTVVSGAVFPAGASSIVVLGASQAPDASIVTLGAAQTTDPSVVEVIQANPETSGSPSIVTLGEPAVSGDTVAAIPAGHPPRGTPMVIRAGIVGGSSGTPVAASASTAAGSIGDTVKASNGTLRDAMTQAGQAPAIAQ